MVEGCWIGVDPGTKYVGVAVGDAASKVAAPLRTLDATPEPQLLKQLSRIATDHAAKGFVVGLDDHGHH
jgi:RNase H-fold protein (predicted Holliday junction resolvase)